MSRTLPPFLLSKGNLLLSKQLFELLPLLEVCLGDQFAQGKDSVGPDDQSLFLGRQVEGLDVNYTWIGIR
jgi:hypothetical protein